MLKTPPREMEVKKPYRVCKVVSDDRHRLHKVHSQTKIGYNNMTQALVTDFAHNVHKPSAQKKVEPRVIVKLYFSYIIKYSNTLRQ